MQSGPPVVVHGIHVSPRQEVPGEGKMIKCVHLEDYNVLKNTVSHGVSILFFSVLMYARKDRHST